MLDRDNSLSGNAIIHKILKRKSVFIRKAAGTSHDVQVVAANIDTVFICMSLNSDFNLRRLERYLSIAWDSGATPVVVLTKGDLCKDMALKLSEERLINYKKLRKEAIYEGLNSRQIEKEKINNMYAPFDGMKNALDYIKSKNKNR